MIRRLLPGLILSIALFVASCSDQPNPTEPATETQPSLAISDAPRGGHPDFLWLPSTVPNLAKPTGPFDPTALAQLTIEICELRSDESCGRVIERFSAKERLIRNQIRVHPLLQFYAAEWLTIFSDIKPGRLYRVRVLRDGAEIGFLDIQVVKKLKELFSVDRSRYTGVIRGEIQPLWFRIQRPSVTTSVVINEVESNGGTPGDWIELRNTSTAPVDLSGYIVKDNDDEHSYTIPAGATIPAGGYLVIEEAELDFGLGGADQARLFGPNGTTIVDSYEWAAHAPTTYGRCPGGTGEFQTTTVVTKGASNDCSVVIRINEVESNGGTPGDWVELFNPAPVARDLAGYVFKDGDDTHGYVLPAGTEIPANGYLVLDEAAFGFGLGGADAARLFASDGVTLVDSYEWTAHATTTYGRCPNGTGSFATTTGSTKGGVNACPGDVTAFPWPGDGGIETIDGDAVFGGNMSALAYEGSGTGAPGVLWAGRNGPGTLFRLIWNGTIWTPDAANDWGAGKALRYPDGTGDPDTEGVAFAGAGSVEGIYVASERNNSANGVSRNSILRFVPTAAGAVLTATHEWNLTADLPVVTPNTGLEAIAWVPDAQLVAAGFFDESKGRAYAPGDYPDHGGGIFFVGVEANGVIYGYALDHAAGSFVRVATIVSGFVGVMDLAYDRELGELWAVCDDGCAGRTAVLDIDRGAGPTAGRFVVQTVFERPAGMANLNNEGFTFAPLIECAAGKRPVFWADDTETGGHAIRKGTLACPAP